MGSMQTPYVSISLTRLRRGVTMCCWVVGLALVAQLLVWCFATFMDVRYTIIEDRTPGQLIVSTTDVSKPSILPTDPNIVANDKSIDPNRVSTKQDKIMAKVERFAYGAGMLGIVMLIPLLVLGAIMSTCCAIPGCEKTVSSFMWAMVIALLILPMGGVLGLPWSEGGLVSYENMTKQVDIEMAEDGSWGSPTFHARFAVLPLACLIGITMVGFGFGAGVHAGIAKEDTRLDPALEREASNVTPSSLHGGRAAVAMRTMNQSSSPAPASAPPPPPERKPAPPPMPSITQMSAGEAPKRLI
jgi:hypothetical protein